MELLVTDFEDEKGLVEALHSFVNQVRCADPHPLRVCLITCAHKFSTCSRAVSSFDASLIHAILYFIALYCADLPPCPQIGLFSRDVAT